MDHKQCISLELHNCAPSGFNLFKTCHHKRQNVSMIMILIPTFKVLSKNQLVLLHKMKPVEQYQHQGDIRYVFWPWWNCAKWACSQKKTMLRSKYFNGLLECLRNAVHREWPREWVLFSPPLRHCITHHLWREIFCQIKISGSVLTGGGTAQLLALL